MKLFPGKLHLTVPLSRHVRVYANILLLKVFECVSRWQLCKETAGLVFVPQCDGAGLTGRLSGTISNKLGPHSEKPAAFFEKRD